MVATRKDPCLVVSKSMSLNLCAIDIIQRIV